MMPIVSSINCQAGAHALLVVVEESTSPDACAMRVACER